MTKGISKILTNWLSLEICKSAFETFRQKLEYDEPIPPFETRFPSRLESVIGSVQATFNKEYLNPTVLEAAAAYMNQFIRGHVFENGNKRMGVLFTHIFLLMNNVDLTLSSQDMYLFAVLLAEAGEHRVSSNTTKRWCVEVLRNFTKEIDR